MGEILIYQKEQRKENSSEWSPKQLDYYSDVGVVKKHIIEKQYRFFLIHLQDEDDEGMEVAQFIREIPAYYRTPIIFLAESHKYEKKAFYDIHCYDYLIKPIREEEVIKIIYPFLAQFLSKEREEKLVFHIRRSTYRISLSDIVFMESGNRNVTIHLKEDLLQIPYVKLCSYARRYPDVFIQCHRSILVNRQYIRSVDYRKGYIQLNEGQVEMGRQYYNVLKKEFDDKNSDVYNEEK